MGGRTTSGEDIPILRPEEIRQLKERHALVVAENGKPIIARLTRCIDGKLGAQLLSQQEQVRSRLSDARRMVVTPEARTTAALVEAKRRGLIDQWSEQ
jgi:type IV secretion system protein VirD4